MKTATLDISTEPPVAWRQDASVIGLVGLAHGSSHFGHLMKPDPDVSHFTVVAR